MHHLHNNLLTTSSLSSTIQVGDPVPDNRDTNPALCTTADPRTHHNRPNMEHLFDFDVPSKLSMADLTPNSAAHP